MSNYVKQRIALKYWLLGKGYSKALEAMTFASSYHTGTRKDKVTPEFAHQVQIASLVRTLLPHLSHPEESISAAFLHDVVEDYGVSVEEIRSRWGDLVAEAVDCMSKEVRGVRKDDNEVFSRIARNEIASVVKLCDRHQNVASMMSVFTVEKCASYSSEAKVIMKNMRVSRDLFPRQEPAYELLKLILQSQLDLVDTIVTVSAQEPLDPSKVVPPPLKSV